MATPDRTELRGRPAPVTVLLIASLGVLMAFVDATIVNIAFPDIAMSFPTVEMSSLSWVLNAYNIVFAAFLVVAGKLADLLGRRRVFLQGIAIFTLASVLCSVAPSVGALVAFRVVQALGAALLVPSSLGLVLNAYPEEKRAHAVALISAVGALAAGLGPSLGGLLVSLDSWRLVFLVNLPIGVIAYILARRQLVESREPGLRRVPDIPGALLFAIAVAALVLAVVQGEEWGWTSVAVVGCFVVALLLGFWFVRRCLRHRSPIFDLGLFRDRTFSVTNAMTVVAGAGFYGYTLVNVLFLVGVWDYSVLQAGLAITPGPFVAAAVAGPTSRMAQRFGHRPVLVAGGLIWGLAVFWFVQRVGLEPDFLGVWLPGMILLGIGAGALFPNLSGAAVASAPGESFGTASGLNSVARQVGAAFGVAAVIALIGNPDPTDPAGVEAAFDHAWTFSAVCLWLAGLGCLAVSAARDRAELARSPSLGDSVKALLADNEPPVPFRPPAPIATSLLPELEPPDHSRPETVADFLGAATMFAGLPEGTRELIAANASSSELGAGEWLFREGDEGDRCFIVRAGRLEVLGAPEKSRIRTLGRGAVLGELALLTGGTRSASVRALRDTELVTIDRKDFEGLLRDRPEVSLALTRSIAGQLRENTSGGDELEPLPGVIAIVPLDQGAQIAEFARSLESALSDHGAVRLLDHAVAGGNYSAASPVATFGPLLDTAAADSDFQVLVTDSADGDWRRFCLQQADRILAISGGGADLSGMDLAQLRGSDLVTLIKSGEPQTDRRFTTTLAPARIYVVRDPEAGSDIARLARRLSGSATGIVLSGGGARAFSQIGVIEELLACGIEIDRVGGVGMGAVIGGMLAMEMGPDEIADRCFDEWMRRNPLGDYTFPRQSLIRGRRLEAMLARTFGQAMIDDLPRSYFCGATDLRSGELVLFRDGSLADAVSASFSPPVVAPIAVRNGQLLTDGSLTGGLPVTDMAEQNEGAIIAVDSRFGDSEQAGRDGQEVPGILEVFSRAFLVRSDSGNRRRTPSLLIAPNTGEVGMLEFHQLDRAREIGREAARQALEKAGDSTEAEE